MAEQITVLIKAANQSIPDLKIECQSDWTVLHLKERIFQLHPVTPNVAEQRLIYSGHLLRDSFTLKTVLRHPSENNAHIVHLVCSASRIPPERKPANPSQNQPNPLTSPLPSTSAGNGSSDASSGVRRRNVASVEGGSSSFNTQQPFMDPASIQPHVSQLPSLSTLADPVQQMAAMQQMYAQYMASYMQYMQSGGLGSFMIPQDVTQPPTTTTSMSAASFMPPTRPNDSSSEQMQQQQVLDQQQNEQQFVPMDGIQQAQQNAQEPRLNVQARGGIGEEEEEGFVRDWLDYIYFASRMLVLLCIVYFYSTLRRFIFVIATSVLIYLYQVGWFRGARQDAEPDPAPREVVEGAAENEEEHREPAPPPPQEGASSSTQPRATTAGTASGSPSTEEPQRDGGSDGGGAPLLTRDVETLGEEAEERGSGGNDPPADGRGASLSERDVASQSSDGIGSDQLGSIQGLPMRPSYLSLAWTFFSSFFISLIPDRQQQIII